MTKEYKPHCYLCSADGPLVPKELSHGFKLVCEDNHACVERVKDKLWPLVPTLVPGGFKEEK